MLLGERHASWNLRSVVQPARKQLPRALHLLGAACAAREHYAAARVHARAIHGQDRNGLRKLRRQRGVALDRRQLGIGRAFGPGRALVRPPSTPRRVMRALAAALALALTLAAQPAAASDPDPWFGPDKAIHFGVSLGLAAGAYAATSPWLESRGERALAGGAFSLTLGAGKELWDLAGHGDPSWRDFTWDVLGTAVGVALAVGVDALVSGSKDAPAEHLAQGLVFHF